MRIVIQQKCPLYCRLLVLISWVIWFQYAVKPRLSEQPLKCHLSVSYWGFYLRGWQLLSEYLVSLPVRHFSSWECSLRGYLTVFVSDLEGYSLDAYLVWLCANCHLDSQKRPFNRLQPGIGSTDKDGICFMVFQAKYRSCIAYMSDIVQDRVYCKVHQGCISCIFCASKHVQKKITEKGFPDHNSQLRPSEVGVDLWCKLKL